MYHLRVLTETLESTLLASLLKENDKKVKDLFVPNVPEMKDSQSTNNENDTSISWPIYQRMFPILLGMMKMLNYVYTKDFNAMLGSEYQPISFAINVESLYNLLNLDFNEYKRVPADKKPTKVMTLEKIVIWLITMRDYICRFIALGTYFGSEFFQFVQKNFNVSSWIKEYIFYQPTSLPLTQYFILLKHCFMPLLHLCEIRYYDEMKDTILLPLFNVYFGMLCAKWKATVSDNADNTDTKKTNHKLKNEIFEDRALREVSIQWMTLLTTMCISPNEKGFMAIQDIKSHSNAIGTKSNKSEAHKKQKPTPEPEEEEIGKSASAKSHVMTRQEQFCKTILLDEKLSTITLDGLRNSLQWSDSSVNIKACLLISKLMKLVGIHKIKPCYRHVVTVLQSLIQAVSKTTDDILFVQFVTLAQTIFECMDKSLSTEIISVFSNIPNVRKEDCNHLYEMLISEPGTHNSAAYKSALRAFLSKFVLGKRVQVSQSFGTVQ
ncbi:hypothetical protein RFI_16764 [Reticulomyxa filosa]|uniref:Exportin-5 C-terminal domain-containing protein n=1 Tax=Reticulomyxa filosa TaxID=46433 RepID=X6N321_RETFI|nr:hypothetical protein RFI_16764 [Reticulomyxa filosa]|eukprot:ETO20451.1 hypothetical protein RFI_16764 [Reticulomyxa filosa]